MSSRIQQLLKICLLGLGLTFLALPAQASFINTDVTFSLFEPGETDLVQIVEVTDALDALEVSAGDGSDIGTNFMIAGVITGEYIDIGIDYVEFQIFGGGSSTPDGTTTGTAADTKYQLDFESGVLALFETPTVSSSNITGLTFSTGVAEAELMVGLDSLMLFIDTIVIGPAGLLGTVRLDFAPISAVPVPAALPLMLSGLAMIGFLARRRKS